MIADSLPFIGKKTRFYENFCLKFYKKSVCFKYSFALITSMVTDIAVSELTDKS